MGDERISGRFRIGTKEAWCHERGDGGVSVEFDGGSFTSAYMHTFLAWRPEPLGEVETAQLARAALSTKHGEK